MTWPVTASANCAALVGRCLVGSLFLAGAVQKGIDPEPAQALLAQKGLPVWGVWPALIYNLLAGLSLMLGFAVRPVALSLAVYCMITSVFHWIPDDPWQMSIFAKNWAIAGGCLGFAAFGGGDWRLGRKRLSPSGGAD